MTISIESIPSATAAPPVVEKSKVRGQVVATHFSRRSLVKSMFALGVTMSLVSLDGLARLSKSYAAPSSWGNCPNWINHPSAEPDWRRCNPDGSAAGYIGGGYCNGNGYHRTDTVDNYPNVTVYSRQPRCINKNAWVWRTDNQGQEPRDRRCSDGVIRRYHGGQQVFAHPSTCQHLLPWRYPPN